MRSREDIEKSLENNISDNLVRGGLLDPYYPTQVILELLLDIRDLLKPPVRTVHPPSADPPSALGGVKGNRP